MAFVTPIDGEEAVAEHVAQITETLSGVRGNPITLTSTLSVAAKPVAVSPTGGNALTWDATGLFVPAAMSQSAADARYEPLDSAYTKAESDGRYLQTATAATTYLPLAGGTLTGPLVAPSVTTPLLGPTTNAPLAFRTNNLTRWSIDTNGHLLPNTDNVYDIASSGGAKPRNVYLAGQLVFTDTASMIQRTAAGALRVDTNLGVGGAPLAWGSGHRSVGVGQASGLFANAVGQGGGPYDNTYYDGTNFRAVVAAPASMITLVNGEFRFGTMASVAAGAIQTAVDRAILGPLGTLTMTPGTGQNALVATGSQILLKLNRSEAASYLPHLAIERQGVGKFHLGLDPSDNFCIYSGDLSKIFMRVHPVDGTLSVTPEGAAALHTTAGAVRIGGAGSILQLDDQTTAGRYFTLFDQGNNFYIARNEGARLVINPSGTTTLYPDAGYGGLSSNGTVDAVTTGVMSPYRGFVDGTLRFQVGYNGTVHVNPPAGHAAFETNGAPINATGGHIVINPTGGCSMIPYTHNAHHIGVTNPSWVICYAIGGVNQTSSYEYKEDFGPLDPAECATAVLETDWVNFVYKPPVFVPPDELEDEEAETREAKVDDAKRLYAESLVEHAPSRHQKGYVLQSPEHKTHDLFGLSDREHTSPASDLAVVACALQHALQRIAALEAQP